MIKFFRKIRQNMLSEGKTFKYFKYAFGEIVLVVIGILIALYINNWNQNRLKKNEVITYFDQIKTELVLDIAYFNNNLLSIKNYTDYLNKVSEGKYSEVDLSLLLYSLSRNLHSRNFGISYNKMLESGIIEYIEDGQISEKLQTYYLINCSEYDNETKFHAKFISDHIEGPLLLMLNHKKDFLVDKEEVIDKLENGKLKSLVNWQISSLEYQTPKINENVIQAEELIQLINQY